MIKDQNNTNSYWKKFFVNKTSVEYVIEANAPNNMKKSGIPISTLEGVDDSKITKF